MTVLSASPSISKKLAAEALGTFVFVLVGAGSAVGTSSLASPGSGASLIIAALANGIGLAVAVSATMSISGGALNPAVTVGLLVGGKIKPRDAAPYIIAQMVGAVAAGLALVASFPAVMGGPVNWGSPSLNGAISAGQGMAIEALLTFFLMFAILGTAVDSRAPKIGGLGIGLAVVADVLVGGNLTGAAMNPARAFGPMLTAGFYPGYWYVYIIGPVVGAVVAALAYRYLIEQTS
ncbi:MAG: aquaporin family protein [Thaumarchaeota archaeon]|nr:aquaporin family protein [Nitrososphaerota archaeon]